MTNHPKVSIFLHSYNHARYLPESIGSVLNQTFSDFELIVLDDASTDDSWAIINSHSDPRIRAFRNKTNQLGEFPYLFPQAATGEYIAVHNSDDIWEIDKLEKQMPFLDGHPEIGAVFTNAMIIGEQGEPFEDKNHFYYNIFNQPNRSRHEWLNFFFYRGNALCHPSVLIRKVCYEQCGLYRYGFFQLPDFDMWIRLCLKYEIFVMQEKLVRFRVRENEQNVSGNQPEKRIRNIYELYKTLENYKKIKRFDDLVKIFPSAEKYNRKKETDVHFALAMVALQEKSSFLTQLFGLDILFELISDPIQSANIKRLYNFDYMNFIDLTAKHDIFSREEISSLYGIVTKRDEQITSLNQAVVDLDGQIINLNQYVNEREGQITSLNQALAERDTRIVNLIQAVNAKEEQIAQELTERDMRIVNLTQVANELEGQIASLNQGLVECDTQIVNLTQAVNAKEEQIAGLNQELAERDTRIGNLTQAVNAKEEQIASLNQALSERDGQITDLNQAVNEREGQITSLNQALSEHDGQIAVLVKQINDAQATITDIQSSNSWRVTAPLRKAVGTIRQGVRSLRMSFLVKIAESLRIQSDIFLGSAVNQIRGSSLFDAEYYLASNPDVRNADLDPAKHYLLHGWREHRDPSAAFSTAQYLFDNPDVAQARINPLIHYIRHGRLEGRPIRLQPSALGDMSSQSPVHSVSVCNEEEVINAAIDAEVRAIRESGFFDESYYRSMYADLQPPPHDVIRHYCEYGWREGRNPSADFDTRFYLATYSDIRNDGINPFWHYVVAGASELRHANYNAAIDVQVSVESPLYNVSSVSISSAGKMEASDPVAAAQGQAKKILSSFPVVDEPLVSVVIPVYNNFEYTWACLYSLQANTGNVSFEIIIMDDGSSDATVEILPTLAGVRYVRNDSNLGFLASCNLGAELARGKYLVLLNNDTEVRPGWVKALLDTFSDCPLAGLVGSKFIFPDGRLLEGGGIVWRDGSACNYGRDGHPDDPRVNYRREVDYVSGACIMLPRDLFNSLGGFDDKFSPAYYEDTDLAFRVRAAGRKVIYQPLSEIVHHEGVTSGTDTSRGVKQYQIINQKTFYERWKDVLAVHGEPGRRHEWEKERGIGLRVLVIDVCICLPDQDSGSVRMFNMLRILQEFGHKVTFFPDNAYYPEPYTSRMRGMGVEVLTAEAAPDLETHLAVWGDLYDVVFLSRLDVAKRHIEAVNQYCFGAFLCFDTVDLHFLREGREAALKGDPQAIQAARARRDEELGVAARADLTIVVSEAERDLLARECPDLPVAVVSNIHDVAGCRMPFDSRQDILFVGGFRHTPNVDAVFFFVREVFPHVRRLVPHIRFHIVGSDPPEEVLALAGDGIEVHGFVPDMEPFLDCCRISVAPLRWGAGVKGKINQSMSYGLPVVATIIAAEGMFLKDGEEVLVADGPKAMADAVVRLYSDKELWECLSQGGLANVRRYFSFDAARSALETILERASGVDAHEGKSLNVQTVPDDSATMQNETGLKNDGKAARLIAFYLPQYHPIPENDEWWGEGFTEWRNVTAARPLFRGHKQPNLPADLGFYDLRLPEVRSVQANLARTYGIEAFCYWHYWFDGKRLLNRPFQEVLSSGKPNFTFCLAWANEPWSRMWDGEPHHILQAQKYGGPEDDRRHFEWLLPALRDPRAFRVDGLPVFLIYKAKALPDVERTVALWRNLARKNGLPGLHLLSIETSGSFGWDPREAGFDAAVEFQPHWERAVALTNQRSLSQKFLDDKRYGIWTLDYSEIWPQLEGDNPPYPRYPGVFPRWDNTPRKGRAGLVFRNSRPEEYGRWLANAVAKVQTQPADRRLVFINAWNEWAEGNYLEPDQTYGRAYLDATLWAVKMDVDFSNPELPSYIGVSGLSYAESYGRWSDGDKVILKFGSKLPAKFSLTITAMAYGPNCGEPFVVKAGNQTKEYKFVADAAKAQSAEFSLSGPADAIEILIPKPTSPPKGDTRRLGLAFKSLALKAIP